MTKDRCERRRGRIVGSRGPRWDEPGFCGKLPWWAWAWAIHCL